ncbi:hypothetical protein EC253486_3075 [Escherichia coli 2534-86]|nr:hypothetical protein EC253486_3075 [Escherichia coli 2534-86]
MCHGLFIELIADIKKPTVKVGFFLGFLHESSLIEYVTT